jgi:hypothetical protein
MGKKYEIPHSSNDKRYIFKVFTVKSNYLKYLRRDVLEDITSLEGKAINHIPFVSAYLKQCICRIEYAVICDKAVQYKLDFEREKIIHENNRPLRIIYHDKVEVIHFYRSSMAVIYANNNTFNKDALNIIMALTYWFIIRNSQMNEINYSKPMINEVNINFLKDFELFRSFLFRYVECEHDSSEPVFILNESFWERDKKRDIYELKLFRKNHIKYYYVIKNGEKQCILVKANGEVESTIPLDISIIERVSSILEMLSLNLKPAELPDNIENYLEQWIELISKDMEQDYKIKKKVNVINDLKKFLYEALKYDEANINISMNILTLSIFVKKLILLCINQKNSFLALDYIDSMEYDALCDFLKLYVRKNYHINLTELELTNVLNRFYLELREDSRDLLTSYIRYDTLMNNKPKV